MKNIELHFLNVIPWAVIAIAVIVFLLSFVLVIDEKVATDIRIAAGMVTIVAPCAKSLIRRMVIIKDSKKDNKR